jgi:ribosomal protein S18 acetylase RimI-like enzyme
MFDAMGIEATNLDWTITTIRVLERDLSSSAIVGAVVDREDGTGLCATGLLHIQETLGSPPFPKGLRGHISSVAVDLEWRKRGLGESILRYLLSEARTRGLERVDLNATPEGERIYRRLGFHEVRSGVDLRLDL